jgi:hypothetical protein
MGGISFASYEDTYQWICTNLNDTNCTYILDIPGLYSLVRCNGNGFTAMFDEEENARTAGYDNVWQCH